MSLTFYKARLRVEVWNMDEDHKIDNFTFTILESVCGFNYSNSLTVQGENGIGNLSVIYYNITTDTASCNSDTASTSSTYFGSQNGKLISIEVVQ